tara:strand:+ start:30193 stop:31020 length:828 start_codon:yes stop_codon:yes gene_type:complete
MKKFCVLEQGKTINDDFTLQHKSQFNTEVSDFYRLNWKELDDPNAQVCHPDACWTEGRSILYDHIMDEYEYYIFIDDDVLFYGENIAQTIADNFDEYKPVSGTLGGPGWHLSKVQTDKPVHPIACYDLCVHIFSRSFAEVMFPAIFHSSGKSMWYAMYACYKLFPRKQLIFQNIATRNSRTGPAEDKVRSEQGDPVYKNFVPVENVISKFEKDLLIKGNYIQWNDYDKSHVKTLNANLASLDPDKTQIDFTIDDLAKIYDINNEDFKNRKPTLAK